MSNPDAIRLGIKPIHNLKQKTTPKQAPQKTRGIEEKSQPPSSS
jgi:hypothetical protein